MALWTTPTALESLGKRPRAVGKKAVCAIRLYSRMNAIHAGVLPNALRICADDRPGRAYQVYNMPSQNNWKV